MTASAGNLSAQHAERADRAAVTCGDTRVVGADNLEAGRSDALAIHFREIARNATVQRAIEYAQCRLGGDLIGVSVAK